LHRDCLRVRISGARVDAADISGDALAVARRNIANIACSGGARVLSDHFTALGDSSYDIISAIAVCGTA